MYSFVFDITFLVEISRTHMFINHLNDFHFLSSSREFITFIEERPRFKIIDNYSVYVTCKHSIRN